MKDKPLLIPGIIILIIFIAFLNIKAITKLTERVEKEDKIYKYDKVSDKISVNEEYDNSFKEIIINSTASDITIKHSPSDKVFLKIYSDEDTITIDPENNKLTINVKNETCQGFCLGIEQSKIELSLPSNYENTINIENNYGNIDISEYEFANINIDSNYGEIEVYEANDLTIDNDYGNITLKKINNYFSVETDFGDIKIDNININNASKASTNYGDIKIDKTNDIHIIATSDLGDTRINHNNEKSDIYLTLNTSFGDIEVNN